MWGSNLMPCRNMIFSPFLTIHCQFSHVKGARIASCGREGRYRGRVRTSNPPPFSPHPSYLLDHSQLGLFENEQEQQSMFGVFLFILKKTLGLREERWEGRASGMSSGNGAYGEHWKCAQNQTKKGRAWGDKPSLVHPTKWIYSAGYIDKGRMGKKPDLFHQANLLKNQWVLRHCAC